LQCTHYKKLFFLTPLFAGVAFAILLTSPLFRISGISGRQETIVHALQQELLYGIMLGNSRVMNGVDTTVLEKTLSANGHFYNLSSGGQTGLESILIMDNLNKPVSHIGLGLSFGMTPEEDKIDVPENVLSKYHLSGFVFSEKVFLLAQKTNGASFISFYGKTSFERTLASRWFFSAAVNDLFRRWLRPDLELEKGMHDLFHPSPYTTKLSEEKTAILIKRNYSSRPAFYFYDSQKELLRHFKAENEKTGRFYFVVIMPVNPKVMENADRASLSSCVEQTKELLGEKQVLDLSGTLSHELFIDDCHPTRTGAQHISRRIAEYLKSNSPAGGRNAF